MKHLLIILSIVLSGCTSTQTVRVTSEFTPSKHLNMHTEAELSTLLRHIYEGGFADGTGMTVDMVTEMCKRQGYFVTADGTKYRCKIEAQTF